MGRVGWILGLVLMASSAQAATLTIRAEGVGSAQGMVYAGICDTSFDESSCPYKSRETAKAGTVELRLRDVRTGSYSIAVFHDTNGKLDRNFVGLPSEPYGFSNNVGRRDPPDFEAATIVVREASTTVVIPIR
ncbi:DUF2141 domain-containing protein [Microvirga pakistanensis]|uniref:DUF2141 domain-containing protein n=1 Tax=Microvirga pakistanensis TaxID=1682650 RepID=UPI001FCE30EB|nr:DUF2141 domain-containing protein [Microvirga pakistanensis]